MSQYFYIQHYNSETRKRKWCNIGKYGALPNHYKTTIHKPEGLYINYTQIDHEENNLKKPP
jgi:hypothetical protein